VNALPSDRSSAINAIVLIATLLMWPLTASAQLKVLISGGFSGAYEQLLPEFERTTGIKVTTGSGSSQGSGPQTIGAQLARGVPADVVILSREGVNELMAANRIATGTDVDLARTPLGVAVRAGAPKPDVSTVEAFKQALLKANIVAVPSSTSGIFLTTEVFPRLGIADKINVKRTPRGSGAAAMVAAGEADLAVMPVSEIVHAPGVELAGKLAEEIQLNQVFAAAIAAGAKEAEAAKRLIAFLASQPASAAIRRSGMEPLGKRSPD
jgi:molybdate transport system substrate-binding protein